MILILLWFVKTRQLPSVFNCHHQSGVWLAYAKWWLKILHFIWKLLGISFINLKLHMITRSCSKSLSPLINFKTDINNWQLETQDLSYKGITRPVISWSDWESLILKIIRSIYYHVTIHKWGNEMREECKRPQWRNFLLWWKIRSSVLGLKQ